MSKNQVIFPLDFYLGHVFDLNVKTADYNSTETMEHMYVGFMYVMYVLITVAFFFFVEFGSNQRDALNKICRKLFCRSPNYI